MRRNLWGGHFSAAPSKALERFNDSFGVDRELLAEDVQGSIAWARELGRVGVLTSAEARKLARGLDQVARRGAPSGDHEDVHSYVEARLHRDLGPLAGKLHTGRSRNDQVATDLRLYLKRAIGEARSLVLSLAESLARRAEQEAGTPMPGYTHLKRAEPVTFGHWCLAYVEMLLRDESRLADAAARGDECPLGSGALAGTPLQVDRRRLARSLGFRGPTANSIDAVADRDMAADYLYATSLHLVHLSRMAEDLIFFGSDELAFVEVPDSLATGSSRMPHKKNPDVLELVRGHAGRAIGDLAGLLAVFKGLPLAYDKDLQLDKEPLFRMRRTLAEALPILEAIVAGLTVHRDRMRRAAADDGVLATELADALAERMPFREAHPVVGRLYGEARASGLGLSEIAARHGLADACTAALDVDRALARRSALGGTAPARVRRAARLALTRIDRRRRLS